jgi:uncharacterized integral membrane protein
MRREGDGPSDRHPAEARGPETEEERQARTRDAIRADDEHLRRLRRARQARVAKLLVALGIVVILIIFVIANSQPVSVDFVFLTRHPRLIWVMVACAVLGGVVGFLLGRPGKQFRFHDDEEKRQR